MNPGVFLMQQICSFWWDILDMLTFCKYNLPIASDLCAFFRFLVLRFGNSHSGTFRLSWRCLTCWATAPKLHKLTRQPNFHWTSKNLREYTWNQLQSLAITCILQAHSTSCCLEWCWAAGVGAKKSQAANTWRVSVFFLQSDTDFRSEDSRRPPKPLQLSSCDVQVCFKSCCVGTCWNVAGCSWWMTPKIYPKRLWSIHRWFSAFAGAARHDCHWLRDAKLKSYEKFYFRDSFMTLWLLESRTS